VPSSNDDGFREIQLNGKQLVFLFMAVTVVLVVTFLSGVLVGRGVRADRAEAAQAEVLNEAPAAPPHATVATPADDPTKAPPPTDVEESPDVDDKIAKSPEPVEEPPVAVRRDAAAPAAPRPRPADVAKADPPAAATPAAKPPAVAAPAPASPSTAPPATAPALAAATPAASPRDGYAVQVAAVNARGEADAIAKRLSGKGYAAYIEDPRGSQKMFRVRVGTFKTRRDAQTVADKLKREEKFKPWVTR
jgi:cell division septation protein DedD